MQHKIKPSKVRVLKRLKFLTFRVLACDTPNILLGTGPEKANILCISGTQKSSPMNKNSRAGC